MLKASAAGVGCGFKAGHVPELLGQAYNHASTVQCQGCVGPSAKPQEPGWYASRPRVRTLT
jgi:hypothetical protein